jgi:hypothetical protein
MNSLQEIGKRLLSVLYKQNSEANAKHMGIRYIMPFVTEEQLRKNPSLMKANLSNDDLNQITLTLLKIEIQLKIS